MNKKFKLTAILNFALCLTIVFQGLAIGQVTSSFNITITAKITTHPDYYSTQFPFQMTAPVVCDLDSDWVLDIVCAGYNPTTDKSSIYVWYRNGVLQPGWPIEIMGKIEGAPAVGDMDSDGYLEIVASISSNSKGSSDSIYIWHHDGTIYKGYPVALSYKPGAPLVGDVNGGFEEEAFVYESSKGIALCDIDMDGKKEVLIASTSGIDIIGGNKINLADWPQQVQAVGLPVVGNVDGDNKLEIFLPIITQNTNYIYGWHNDGTAIAGWPLNIGGVINTPGNFISLGDIDNDGEAEILSGSINGWIAGWRLNGTVVFSDKPATDAVYQPIGGDIDSDGDMEIIATSKGGKVYCYDHKGNPVKGWPYSVNYELSQGAVLVDIDSDSLGDPVNPANDLELLFSAYDGQVHALDLPGNYNPNKIQWGMYGYNSRNTANYLRDWDTVGWSIFDDIPSGVKIESVYDWNRGTRVIELKGAGLNNAYTYKKENGLPFDSKNTTLQWSMRYSLPFNIYVSIDTLKGIRYLCYSPTDGNQLIDPSDPTGKYIHHGLGGSAKNGRWHTYVRNLVTDLKDAEPTNEIIDVNAIYVQGSGRIDDIMLLPGTKCADLVNLALNATVTVSSGILTKNNINDGNPSTKWVSDVENNSFVIYSWSTSQKLNEIIIREVGGATECRIFVIDSNGSANVLKTPDGKEWFSFPKDGSPLKIGLDESLNDVKSIIIEFNNKNASVSVGEIEVYYDPNIEKDNGLPQEKYSEKDYINIKDGYFYNPMSKKYWLPHGIAYQTWNKALGQWQTPSELKKDLDKMAKIGVNALRVDFVWKHIETQDDVFDWSRYDMLLEEAQTRGIKVFPLIGYQWPPDWFKKDWYTMHPTNEKHPNGPWQSDILSYEDLEGQKQFADFLHEVVRRYSVGGEREDLGDTVSGWILGNEYGYLGLWSIEYDGYDPDCQSAFRQWLENKYPDITALNAKWANDNIKTPGYLPNYPYKGFNEVDMPIPFGYQGSVKGKYLARDKASWYDLTEWREESIAKFVALAAQVVKDTDPYHLITYAAVGMQWGEEDWRYHTEDARKITESCKSLGVPLDFWSINNYPWGLENSELMTGQWGIERARHDTGLPVMITETGFTSTETMYLGIDEKRQGILIRNAIWEALESGAIGVCVFHWNDRVYPGLTKREEGFGIVTSDRKPKSGFYEVGETFLKMDEIDIANYLVGSKGPKPDVAFLWDDAVDSIVNRYEAEMKELFGTLERLGFEPTFIDDKEVIDAKYLDYKAIILPRNQKMFDDTFYFLDYIMAAGVKLHANCDLPGIMDEYGEPRNKFDWLLAMKNLFGIDATNSQIDPDLEDSIYYDGYETSSFGLGYKPKILDYTAIGFNKTINMWKYRDKISTDGGIATAFFGGNNSSPALVFHFDSVISLFSLGDNKPLDNTSYGAQDWTWGDRYDWMKSIYIDKSGFNIQPDIIASNKYILADYRKCKNGDILLSLKNYKSDSIENVTVFTNLITSKVVKDLLKDTIIADPSNGSINRTLEPDGHDLLLAYQKTKQGSQTKTNTQGAKTKTQSSSSANTTNTTSLATSTPSSSSKSSTSTSASTTTGSTSSSTTLSTPSASLPTTSTNSFTGPVILYERETKNTTTPKAITKTQPAADSKKGSYKRTYTGTAKSTELPPLQQFDSIMEESIDREMGITPAVTEPVQYIEMQKILERANKPEPESPKNLPQFNPVEFINKIISKLKRWWCELAKNHLLQR